MEPVQDKTSFLMMQIMRMHRNRVEAALAPLGLHVGQEIILMHLWEREGQTQSHLVEAIGVEPPTISKMLQRLEENGFVRRCPDRDDGRVTRVYLTEKGRKVRTKVVELWCSLEETMLAQLTETERTLLRRLLLQVHSNLVESIEH